MFRSILVSGVILIGTTSACMGAARSLEQAFETSSEIVTLPDRLPARVTARGCSECQSLTLEIPADAEFFIGANAVSLQELKKFILGKRYNMVIFHQVGTTTVTRIKVTGVSLNQPPAGQPKNTR